MRVVSGTARGKKLKTPAGMRTRPTSDRVKEAMFSILQFHLRGANILDLFGGTGQLGIEAMSRGANSAVFVDQSADACKLIRENLSLTGFSDKGKVVQSDYASYLKQCKEKFQIILLDPPYAEDFLENSLKIISEIDILQSSGIIVAEHSAEKVSFGDFRGLNILKSYKYGNTFLTVLRKIDPDAE